MAYLVLVRHGESEWNALGLWTGWVDVALTKKGRAEARRAARALKNITFHSTHTSKLKRAKTTLDEIKKVLKIAHIPTNEHEALNEKNYGELAGKNKWKIKEQYGEGQFKKWRRSWADRLPGGESLKDVHGRIVPYYEQVIFKELKEGKNVLVTAHSNSLRALVKHLEQIADHEIPNLEIGIGEVYVYQINEKGEVVSKEIRAANPKRGKQ